MARKKKKAPEGAPLWVVSYGDMMSLLLTFFIMLASMANYDEVKDKFQQAIQSIRDALGMTGQVGKMVDTSVDFSSLIQKLESIVKPELPKNRGDTQEEGIYGRNFRLRRIRDGMEITIGGPVLFEPFSTQLTPQGEDMLGEIAQALKGHRNMIDIRGHAGEQPRPSDWTYTDAMDLSYQRSKVVANELIRSGIDGRTFRLMAVGGNEPIKEDRLDPSQEFDGRRVEIIVRESVLDDYAGETPANAAGPPLPEAIQFVQGDEPQPPAAESTPPPPPDEVEAPEPITP